MKENYSKIDDKFILDNEWILQFALKKYCNIPNYDDVCQEARIWLIEAKYKWKKKKASWNTFACRYISWKYQNYVKMLSGKKRSLESNGYKHISFENIDQSKLPSNHKDFKEISDATIMYDNIISKIENIRNREIVEMRLNGFTYKDIGEKYDLTAAGIRLIFNKELEVFKQYFNTK